MFQAPLFAAPLFQAPLFAAPLFQALFFAPPLFQARLFPAPLAGARLAGAETPSRRLVKQERQYTGLPGAGRKGTVVEVSHSAQTASWLGLGPAGRRLVEKDALGPLVADIEAVIDNLEGVDGLGADSIPEPRP